MFCFYSRDTEKRSSRKLGFRLAPESSVKEPAIRPRGRRGAGDAGERTVPMTNRACTTAE